MKKYYIITGSITYALRGKDVLSKKSIRSSVEHVQNKFKNSGCGYALVVSQDNLEKAKAHLENSGVKILGIEEKAR